MFYKNNDLIEQGAIAEDVIKSEAKFRSFFENSLDGFLLADPNKSVIAANPVACKLFQLSEAQICAKSITELFKYAEPKLEVLIAERNLKGNAKGEVMLQQRDGTVIPIEVKTVLFKDANGEEYSSIIISDNSDISQRIAAEMTLQKSEANLKTILNNTEIAFILVDSSLKVISFNNLAKDISILQGYENPAEGTNIMDYFPADRQSHIRQVIDSVLAGNNMAYEAKRLDKDGSEHWFALKWISITNDEQQNLGFILSIEDISKTIFAAIESEQITAELLKRNKDLEEFTYVVSHNLRAPVANIIGLVEIIGDLLQDIEGAEPAINGLSVSIKKLDGVIKDLNHVLQIREKAEEQKENINFFELMKDIELSINHLIVKRKVKIKLM